LRIGEGRAFDLKRSLQLFSAVARDNPVAQSLKDLTRFTIAGHAQFKIGKPTDPAILIGPDRQRKQAVALLKLDCGVGIEQGGEPALCPFLCHLRRAVEHHDKPAPRHQPVPLVGQYASNVGTKRRVDDQQVDTSFAVMPVGGRQLFGRKD